MTLTLRLKARRVGNSVGILIPAREAKEANIRPGAALEVTVRPAMDEIFGFARHLRHLGPYNRHKEGIWRDRF